MMNGEVTTMPLFVPLQACPAVTTRRTGTPGWASIGAMVKIPESTKDSLQYRLAARARERWPQIPRINTRFRAGFAYVDAVMTDADVLPLCRLRYGGYANMWGFAIYRASHDDYQDSYLATGNSAGPAEDALDTACGLYLAEPTAWT